MKHYKTFLLAIASLLFTQFTYAQCDAAISYTGTSPTFTFSADSAQPGDTILWNFEDGTTSNLTNPTHTFPYNGHYWVHLSIQNGNCWDTSGVPIDVTNLTPAPCDPSFTSTSSGTTYTFTPTNPQPYYNYYWHFGDGTTSNSSNPVHTYTNNGSYNVTCTLQNYYPYLCNSSQSATVVASSLPCNASFSTIFDYNAFLFTPISTPSSPSGSYTYLWDFGDGNTLTSNTMVYVTHSYTATGNYTVTCTLTDGACSNTVSSTISVSSIYVCNATFSIAGNGPSFSFSLNNTPSNFSKIFWDFGDGTTGDSSPSTHTYSNNGTYTVTCSIFDTIGLCNSIASNPVTVVNIGSTTISGIISMSNNPADFAKVYLIQHDSVLGTLTAIDSISIGTNGAYSFSTVSTGNYLVKAGLLSTSVSYSSYLPTYYYNNSYGKLIWSNGNYATSPNNNVSYDIPLIIGTNPGGPAFVSGLISQGANKVGDPIENVIVIVTELNGDPVSFGYSDASGKFNINSLPYGDYLLYPEVMGKTTTPMQFTLSATNPSLNNFVVEVNSKTVDVSIVSSIKNVLPFNNIKLYPNPVQNSLSIDFGKNITTTVTIDVLDISGRLISSQDFVSGNSILIDTAPLSQGTFLLKLSSPDGTQVFQFVK